jgi:hypothetical protein
MANSGWKAVPGIAAAVWLAAVFGAAISTQAAFTLAGNGAAQCEVLTQPGATEAEKWAATTLAGTLKKITGAEFKVSEIASTNSPATAALVVGPGPAAAAWFPEVDFAKLGPEECVMRVNGNKLLLAGGRPRGTIYAVSRFLQEQGGVRWWTPWASTIPAQSTFSVTNLNVTETPAFEYRAPYWTAGFDPVWKALNGANGEHGGCAKELGGCVSYKGFAHTFYVLVPPDKYFAEHPEWFSLIKGVRTTNHAQLCLTNPKLRDFVVQRVKESLRESPDAQIVSVTQNDWNGWCECPDCQALDDAEGSHSGTMLSFANYVAEHIEAEFPNVAVDTFAYTYSRKPPKTLRARPNVIVRLCSIECNFREPLTDPSNAAFADDIRRWSVVCPRLYIWDYVTDFRHYVHPHPNWYSLGPNLRFFQQYGVKGIFEEGAYHGYGAEMSEMRNWVLAQLLWNPKQDDRALVREFIEGYYGRAAAKPILEYLSLEYNASRGLFLGCYLPKDPLPHLNLETLSQAERLWQQAEAAVADDPELLARVREGHLPVRYAFLKNWNRLRREGWEKNAPWPLPEPRDKVVAEFREVCAGVPGKDWTRVTILNEHRLTVEDFLKNAPTSRFNAATPPPPERVAAPPMPADLTNLNASVCVDLQDNAATLTQPGKLADIFPDPLASDQRAARMPGDHNEWAFRIIGGKLPSRALDAKWNIYAVVRVGAANKEIPAGSALFTAGVYDTQTRKAVAEFSAAPGPEARGYHSYLIGTTELNAHRDIWIAPAKNPAVKAVWIDRVYLAPAS